MTCAKTKTIDEEGWKAICPIASSDLSFAYDLSGIPRRNLLAGAQESSAGLRDAPETADLRRRHRHQCKTHVPTAHNENDRGNRKKQAGAKRENSYTEGSITKMTPVVLPL